MERYLPIKHPWVDSSIAPLYRVTFPASSSDEQLLAYCRAVEGWSARVSHPVAWLMDLSRVAEVSAHQRAMFAKYMRGMEAFDRRCTKGTALILSSALMRGVVTAIFWLYDPPFQHRTFSAPGDGQAWLRQVLGEVGVGLLPGASATASLRPGELASVRPGDPASARPLRASESAAPRARATSTPGGTAGEHGR